MLKLEFFCLVNSNFKLFFLLFFLFSVAVIFFPEKRQILIFVTKMCSRYLIFFVVFSGHEMPPKSKNMHYTHKYNLQDQIDHKITIIRKYVPQNCKLFVIAHSMGAKITQEMLKEPDIEQRIATSFMLFPTVERIGDTPNARFVRPMIQYMGFPLVFLSLVSTEFRFRCRNCILN